MLITVVVPAYNEEKYIVKTLESVKNLEHDNFDIEIVVINGSSTDNTEDLASKNGARVITVPKIGIGFSRQKGLQEARGEIVAFTDADSIVPKDWLIKHVELLKKSGAVGSFGPYNVIETDGKTLFSIYINKGYLLLRCLPVKLKLFFASGQNIVMWKNKAIDAGGFDKSLKVMEDVDIMLRLARVGKVAWADKVIVQASGRRSNEGLSFLARGLKTSFNYYFLRKRGDLDIFPDYR